MTFADLTAPAAAVSRTPAGSQAYRLECWSGDIPEGRTAEGLFNWTAGDDALLVRDKRNASLPARATVAGTQLLL
jgi:hypothetical protein